MKGIICCQYFLQIFSYFFLIFNHLNWSHFYLKNRFHFRDYRDFHVCGYFHYYVNLYFTSYYYSFRSYCFFQYLSLYFCHFQYFNWFKFHLNYFNGKFAFIPTYYVFESIILIQFSYSFSKLKFSPHRFSYQE